MLNRWHFAAFLPVSLDPLLKNPTKLEGDGLNVSFRTEPSTILYSPSLV